MSQGGGKQRRLQGIVVSDRAAKTIAVEVTRRFAHPRYGKRVRRDQKFYAHDEGREAHVGDTVEIVECRPMSRMKRWRLVRVVKRGPELGLGAVAEAVSEQRLAE